MSSNCLQQLKFVNGINNLISKAQSLGFTDVEKENCVEKADISASRLNKEETNKL